MKKIIHLTIGPFCFVIRRLGRRYEVRYKYNKKHLLVDLILFLAIVFLIFFNLYITFIFTKWVISLQVKVEVEVSQPVVSGGQTTYTIYYINSARKRNIEDVQLTLKLPPEFILKQVSDDRYDSQNQTLDIGDLPPESEGQLKLTGEIWAVYNSQQVVYAYLDYYQQSIVDEKIKWQDQRIARTKYQIEGSVINLEINAPKVVAHNSSFDFYLACQNNYSQPLEGIKIIPQITKGFYLIDSELELVRGEWLLGKLEPGETKTLKVIGKFSFTEDNPPAGDLGVFELFIDYQGQPLLQDQEVKEINIFYPHFELNTLINGVEDYSPIPGEELEYLIKYKNQEEQKIKDIYITLDLSDPLYNLSSIKSESDFILENSQLSFNQDLIPELESLESGQEGDIKFKIKTQRQIKGSQSPTYLNLKPWVNYTVEYLGEKLAIDVEFEPVANLLSSDLNFIAWARYYTLEGEQLGVGPLPPVVGVETKYWLLGQITNSYNDVINVRVVGTLPNNVIWLEKESVTKGPSVSFDPGTRQISWLVDDLDKFTGYQSLAAQSNFAVILTPRADQVGQFAPLIKNIRIFGQDKRTGRNLERYIGTITTDLRNDQRARQRGGRVVAF